MKTFHTPVLAIFLCLITHLFFPSNVKAQTVDYLKIGDTYVFSSSHSEYLALHYLKCEKNQVAELKAGAHATSSFKVVAGLAGGNSISLESVQYPGHYLRHQGFELKLHPNSSDDLFKKDASFKQVKGLANNQEVSLEAVNLPEHYILHKNFKYYVKKSDGSSDFPVGATHDFINETKRLSQSANQIQQGTSYTFTPKNLPNHSCYADKNQIVSLKATASISDKSLSSFKVVAGLTGTNTISLQSVKYPDHYLHHANLELKLVKGSSDETFKRDASFYAIQGLADAQQVSFESMSFPDFYIRHKDSKLYVKKSDNSADFHAHATFGVANPLASNTASNSNTGSGANTSSNTGSGSNTSSNTGSGSSTASNTGSGSSTTSNTGSGSSTTSNTGSGSSTTSNTGSGSSTTSNTSSGSSTTSNTSSGSSTTSNTSSGSSTASNTGSGTNTSSNTGSNNLIQQGVTYSFLSKNFPTNCFQCEKDQQCTLTATKDIKNNHVLSHFKVVAGLDGGASVSFESIKYPNHYLRNQGNHLKLQTGSGDSFKKETSFKVVQGLADNQQVSFEAVNLPDHYIKHSGLKLFVHKTDNSDLFKADATFNRTAPISKLGIGQKCSFEALSLPNHYIETTVYGKVKTISTDLDKAGASFEIVPGLAGKGTLSLLSILYPGYYLVYQNSELRLQTFQSNDPSLDKNASFKVQDGLADKQLISFELIAQPGAYLRHKNNKLYIEKPNGNPTTFQKDATFKIKPVFSNVVTQIPPNESAKNMGISLQKLYTGNAIHSFESLNLSKYYIEAFAYGKIADVKIDLERAAASFRVIPGFDGQQTVSLESIMAPGYYLTYKNSEVNLQKLGTDKSFKQNASFKIRKGLANNQAISFESISQPSFYIKPSNFVLVMEQSDGSEAFKKNATFKVSNGFLDSFVLPANTSAEKIGIKVEDLYTGNAIYSIEFMDDSNSLWKSDNYSWNKKRGDLVGKYDSKEAIFKILPGLTENNTISIFSTHNKIYCGYNGIISVAEHNPLKTSYKSEVNYRITEGLANSQWISFMAVGKHLEIGQYKNYFQLPDIGGVKYYQVNYIKKLDGNSPESDRKKATFKLLPPYKK